jgi:hypothetical protein
MWVVEVQTHKFLPLAPVKEMRNQLHTMVALFLGKKRLHMSVGKEFLQNHDGGRIFL